MRLQRSTYGSGKLHGYAIANHLDSVRRIASELEPVRKTLDSRCFANRERTVLARVKKVPDRAARDRFAGRVPSKSTDAGRRSAPLFERSPIYYAPQGSASIRSVPKAFRKIAHGLA